MRFISICGMLAAAPALAQCPPSVVFTNFTALQSGFVPGISPPTRFAPGSSPTLPFQQIAVSPNGEFWALRGAAGSSSGQIVLRGTARTRAGAQLVVRRAVTPVLGTRTCDLIGEHIDVDDAGVVALTGDLSGAMNDDAFSARWNGAFTLLAREGQPVPALNFGFGTVNIGPTLLSNGQVTHVSDFLTGSGGNAAIVSLAGTASGSVQVLTNSTMPTGQLASPAHTLALLGAQRVACSSDGQSRVFAGVLAGPTATDGVLLHNNHVIAQEGFAITGTAMTSGYQRLSTGITPTQCAPTGGLCAARVTLMDASDAILHIEHGVVIGTLARTGQEIAPGTSEFYSDAFDPDTFLACAVASNGDWIVVGATTATDPLRDTVLVFRGSTVLLREGDPFDLNEDGTLNDNAFVGSFGQDGLAISDTGDVYVTVSVRGSAGNVTGSALLTLPTPRCNDLDFNNDEVFPSDQDTIDFLEAFAGATCQNCDNLDFNNDCVFPSDTDVFTYFNVLSGGPCTP
jgi:hypothetical protein